MLPQPPESGTAGSTDRHGARQNALRLVTQRRAGTAHLLVGRRAVGDDVELAGRIQDHVDVALTIFSLGNLVFATDPGPLHAVTPVDVPPGEQPEAQVDVGEALGLPPPPAVPPPAWHVLSIATGESGSRGLVRVSMAATMASHIIPRDAIRRLPRLLAGSTGTGVCGCLVNAPDLPPIVLVLDLVHVVRRWLNGASAPTA